MGRKPLLAAFLLAALALAGCSGGGGDDDGGGATLSTSASGTSSATNTTAPNRPPTATLSASVNGTAAAFNLTGSDPDGDALDWTLAFGDGNSTTGTGLPANATHDYGAGGNFTANLTVSDGKASFSTQIGLVATAGGGALPGQVAQMAWDVGLTDEAASTGPPFLDCADGPSKTFNYDSFTLDVATVGAPFKATITDASGGAAITGWTLYFNLEDCSDYSGTFSAEGAAEITGTVPEGSSPFAFAMASGGFLLEVEYRSGSQVA